MSKEFPFPSASSENDPKEQPRIERSKEREACTDRFIAYMATMDELNDHQVGHLAEYVIAHPGPWEYFDDERTYVSFVRIEDVFAIVDFCSCQSEEDGGLSGVVTMRIPLSG